MEKKEAIIKSKLKMSHNYVNIKFYHQTKILALVIITHYFLRFQENVGQNDFLEQAASKAETYLGYYCFSVRQYEIMLWLSLYFREKVGGCCLQGFPYSEFYVFKIYLNNRNTAIILMEEIRNAEHEKHGYSFAEIIGQ